MLTCSLNHSCQRLTLIGFSSKNTGNALFDGATSYQKQ